jgi:hypothetical protein
MNPRTKKILLSLLALVLLVQAGLVQRAMNRDRDTLGLTRVQPLENAPPVLAFTTVALGGFRGLISNALWIRANELQENDKFFEMAQLADWITKLEPHFAQVWINQAWNMAYNISVKFKDFGDRWRWVKRGIELLRDEGLRYNPNEILMYRELGWFFQHKMGANLDDANMYYKVQWLKEMQRVFGTNVPNLEVLLHPATPQDLQRLSVLTNEYKMDPAFMKQVDETYGPLEWRLPEASAIYWAAQGLRQAQLHPEKVKADDRITLRRVIYQSMQLSFQRGRLVANPLVKPFEFGPNLEIIPKVSAAYEQAAKEDASNADHILRAHRNFLRDAVYFLYAHNRLKESAYWFNYLGKAYPEKLLIDGRTNSLPGKVTLDEYAVYRVQEDVGETMSRDRVKASIEGLVTQAYLALAVGEDDRAAGFKLLADKVRETYVSKTKDRGEALEISSIADIQREMLNRLLDPKEGLPFEVRAILRSKLGMEAEAAQPAATPAPAPNASETPAPQRAASAR